MNQFDLHAIEIQNLQKEFLALKEKSTGHVSLKYGVGHSNTTRSKTYKNSRPYLNCDKLDQIIHIDSQNNLAFVEPRVTMEKLVRATLSQGLIPPVVPEFKGITVGGAVMGEAAESGSHVWGTFHDTCNAFEILCGNGEIKTITPTENPELFYGIAGSYGSFGALLSAEIRLIPAKQKVELEYLFFNEVDDAISKLRELMHQPHPPDFLDGILITKDCVAIIKGMLSEKAISKRDLFTQKIPSEWYFQHVQNLAAKKQCKNYREEMSVYDYLFRLDRGAFWMGAYLFKPALLIRLLTEGICKIQKPTQDWFTNSQIDKFYSPQPPKALSRILSYPLTHSQRLWSLLHKAEKWVQDRFCIQDFCIPETNAIHFIKEVLEDPAIFPLWLCPIKGTSHPQIFSPHLLSNDDNTHFINIGIYGLANYSAPQNEITGKLEQKTQKYDGRKVLYSRSYYSKEQFWQIYSYQKYFELRKQTQAEGVWLDITEKVLSE